ncbi:dolichyl-phosphate-mannose--protein mannosyltransferase [Curtobacterium ammoniigenes]|uniref:dolichyl-phosphate-mannose--protein mannosyltransferase n=1 Tax=Curtobacterium ammoniigenes TaxID=395387 RepID=UPI000B1CD475|nr:phospholipid carrier-dependent glycosyltransferase [Curtobacterium ammoniigenes]
MTTELAEPEPTAPSYLVEPRGTRLDAWWGRVLSVGWRLRVWRWTGPLAVTLLAAFLRLWDLGRPHALVFDETYYVKDAWSLIHLGYEGTWPASTQLTNTTDAKFAAGAVNIYSHAPEFIAHPPLGKYIIGLGELAFGGATNAVGWRISVALIGIATVFLVAVIARSLLRSTLLGTVAGFLMAIDGQAIVMSRVSLLDGIVGFFALLAFGALLLDRRWMERRLDRWIEQRASSGRDTLWGPWMWNRPWLFAMGAACGLAMSTKWTGLYFVAFFAVYSVLTDMMAQRRAGIEFWLSSAILRQGPISFVLTVPITLVLYLVSWSGWFLTSGGYDRTWIQSGGGTRWHGVLAWVPTSFQNWWHYQVQIYDFNIGLHTPHSYAANPLTWMLMVRPTSMYYVGTSLGQSGCTSERCGAAITDIANPFIWYAAVLACVVLLVLFVTRRRWEYGFILLGVAAGYLPWLLYIGRTVFQFYTIAFEPYMVMALAAVIGLVIGHRDAIRRRRTAGLVGAGAYLLVATAASAYWYPMWTGMQESWAFISSHYWFRSWL